MNVMLYRSVKKSISQGADNLIPVAHVEEEGGQVIKVDQMIGG